MDVERQTTDVIDLKATLENDTGAVLVHLLGSINSCETEVELLEVAIGIVCECTESKIGWIGALDADGNFKGICRVGSQSQVTPFDQRLDGLWAEAVSQGEPIIRIGDDCPSPLALDPKTSKLSSLVIVPFAVDSRCGFIAAANSPNPYEASTVNLLVDLSKVIAVSLGQKRIEESLREREERFRVIADSARDGIVMIDSAGEVTYWNEAAERMFGYTADEMMGQELHLVITPKHLHTAYLEGFQRFQETGTGPAIGKTLELPAIRKDGSEFTVELSLSAVRSHDGWHAIGLIRDITERKQAEAILQESEQRFRAIFEDSADGIVIGDFESRGFRMVNKKIREMLGYEGQELEKLSISDIWAERWQGRMADVLGSLSAEPTQSINGCEIKRKDGSTFHADVVISLLSLGGRRHFMAIIRDITQRKALEYQLAQVQKLQSIGQLAAGIAHEINTPMQYIGDNTLFLKDAFGDLSRLLHAIRSQSECKQGVAIPGSLIETIDIDFIAEEIPKAIDQILEGVKRVTKIVKAMKDFSHPDEEVAAPFDLNKAIESTVTIARNEWKYVADCELQLDPSLPPILGFQGEFNQAILNMVINAAHAIGEVVGKDSNRKGKITITTRRDGDWVEVRISDTGCGIPPEVRNRIFDPFFTTKEVGKGTGQGLTIAHSVIVEKHKGSLRFESEVGKGTTFIIRLPIRQVVSEGAQR